MTGSEFCNMVRSMRRLPERENAIFAAVQRGDMVAWPTFRVDIGERGIEVPGDYLSIGELDDFVRMPVSGGLALEICALLGMRCPTAEEVDAIWRAADVKLDARPQGAPYDDTMMNVNRLERHNAAIEAQRDGRSGLVAGHKKDILGLRPDGRLAFYGWQHLDGTVIQHDNGAHEGTYADYSHGLRPVFDCVQRDTWPA